MVASFTSALRRLLASERGAAFMEFGLMLPFILLVMLGGVEVTRYVLINQKLDKTSFTMADLVAQADEISASDVDMVFNAVEHLMQPYSFSGNGRVIITSLGNRQDQGTRVFWQRSSAGTLSVTSTLGTPGQLATLPDGFTVDLNEDAIFAEVYYDFEPLIMPNILPTHRLYKYSVYHPRLGALDTLM